MYKVKMMVFDAVHIPRGLKLFNEYIVNKFKFLDTLDIIVYFYVCVVLLSVLFCSYVSIFQTNVALHKIL